MDLLSQQLRDVHLSGGVFFRSEFSAPFCIETPSCEEVAALLDLGSRRVVPFHLVVDGDCEATIHGHGPLSLTGGDIVVFLHDGPHVMASPGAKGPAPIAPLLPPPPYQGIQLIRFGGNGPVTTVICGFLFHERVFFNPLLQGLPKLLMVSTADNSRAVAAAEIFSLIEKESGESRPGSACLLARLTELMFIEVLRTIMEQLSTGDTGWLAGLRDPFVAKALRLFHARPHHPWTVSSVCQEVGLSRSAFVERFTAAVGIPPMRYLSKLRIQRATDLLRDTGLTVATVAARVGYRSEVAFSRSFRRLVGVPPATWRRRHASS
jgi:AraC-like DNA-binding protein